MLQASKIINIFVVVCVCARACQETSSNLVGYSYEIWPWQNKETQGQSKTEKSRTRTEMRGIK